MPGQVEFGDGTLHSDMEFTGTEHYIVIWNLQGQNITWWYGIYRDFPSLYNIVQICTTLYKSVQHCKSLHNIVQVWTTLYKSVKHCTSLYNIVQVCTTLYKSSNIVKVCTSMQLQKNACSYKSLHAVTWAYMQFQNVPEYSRMHTECLRIF